LGLVSFTVSLEAITGLSILLKTKVKKRPVILVLVILTALPEDRTGHEFLFIITKKAYHRLFGHTDYPP
jgi:hypothetical protein